MSLRAYDELNSNSTSSSIAVVAAVVRVVLVVRNVSLTVLMEVLLVVAYLSPRYTPVVERGFIRWTYIFCFSYGSSDMRLNKHVPT